MEVVPSLWTVDDRRTLGFFADATGCFSEMVQTEVGVSSQIGQSEVGWLVLCR